MASFLVIIGWFVRRFMLKKNLRKSIQFLCLRTVLLYASIDHQIRFRCRFGASWIFLHVYTTESVEDSYYMLAFQSQIADNCNTMHWELGFKFKKLVVFELNSWKYTKFHTCTLHCAYCASYTQNCITFVISH